MPTETNLPTLDAWLKKHPYLQPVADLQAAVECALAQIPCSLASIPEWDGYDRDYRAGVPLLRTSAILIDFNAIEPALLHLVKELDSKPIPEKIAHEIQGLGCELETADDAPRRAVSWLLGNDSFWLAYPGLLNYLGWMLLGRYFQPIVSAFTAWRYEERWLRHYCPTCGSAPAMAQLIGVDPGRHRFFLCGHCRTRWRFRRVGCPFCDNEDDTQLGVIGVEDEEGLRVDYCQACGGYLKTYNAQGIEDVMLADWTSLHLDVIARDRGLKRSAGSLYEL